MTEVLTQKRQEVIATLIERLGTSNKDYENCLNANMILTELSDNEQLFGKLVETQNVTRLIVHACDIRNPNQSYALSVLTSVFKEYPNYEQQIGSELSQEFQQTVTKSFFDITYTCLLMLRASDQQLGEVPHPEQVNQAGIRFKRFGAKRMRALELLRQEIQTFSKYVNLGDQPQHLSIILRKQIVSTMLDVIENFDFSNVASQLGIQVLDFLKGTFDDADLEQLKNFVKKQLTTQDKTFIQFESGRLTHRGHLAAIIKMALVLKKLTLEGGMLEVSKKAVP